MIHELDDGSRVISSGGMWLPGNYDSDQAARYAFRFSSEVLQGLEARVCHKDGEFRAITMDDLRAAKAAQDGTCPQCGRGLSREGDGCDACEA